MKDGVRAELHVILTEDNEIKIKRVGSEMTVYGLIEFVLMCH